MSNYDINYNEITASGYAYKEVDDCYIDNPTVEQCRFGPRYARLFRHAATAWTIFDKVEG